MMYEARVTGLDPAKNYGRRYLIQIINEDRIVLAAAAVKHLRKADFRLRDILTDDDEQQ